VVVATHFRMRYAVIIYGVGLVIIWGVFFAMGMVTPQPRQRATKPGPGGGDE
jgi:hypothetical protein